MARKNILIADSGATKTTWCLLNGSVPKRIETQGISPYFLNRQEIKSLLTEELDLPLSRSTIDEVFFYGTGLSVADKAHLIKEVLAEVFEKASIEVDHDLTGAARALCQKEEGIACILGTGSGACYYDGTIIRKISPGLGFILGDEGSGAYLGKMVVQKYLYQSLNPALTKAFEKEYQPDKSEILDKVYRESFPNRYLASYARFLGKNRGDNDVEAMLERGIKDFLTVHINTYKERLKVPVHFVGGVADAFQDVVMRLCTEERIRPGHILQEPMDGLVQFHGD